MRAFIVPIAFAAALVALGAGVVLVPVGATAVPAQPQCEASALIGDAGWAPAAIGRDAAQKIWFRALTTYFTSGTTYAQARTGTLNAARDLYGTGSSQYNAVAAAWSAVSVG